MSPIVDLCFFLIVTLLVWLISRFSHRIPAIRLLVFLLTFLTIYDWLILTNRLYHRACLILALGVSVAFVSRGMVLDHFHVVAVGQHTSSPPGNDPGGRSGPSVVPA